MTCRITNTSDGPVLVRLRSGATVHLAAGEETDDLEEVDVVDNPRLDPLLARNLIVVATEAKADRGGKAGGRRGGRGSAAAAEGGSS